MMAPLCTRWWFVSVLGLMVSPQQIKEEGRDGSISVFYLDPWPQEPSTRPHEPSTSPPATATMSAACPTNVCANGGRCHVLHGEPRCLCKPGFMGDMCQDLRLQLSCKPDGMTLGVLRSALQELNIDPSVLHMSNPACKLLATSNLHLSVTLTHENHTQCGTVVQVNGSHLIYTNELSSHTAEERAEDPSSMISRSPGIQIGFSCVYRYDRVVSLPFPLVASAALVTFVVKEGAFNVTMTLHPTAKYLAPYDRPPVIPLNQRLYVQLQIHGHSPQNYFTLKLEECWATPWAHHGSTVRHLLITNGIADDSTVDVIETVRRSVSRFSLQMFRFIQYREVYLHCRIRLCPHNATYCHQQPVQHKREVSDPYRKVVSCGPVHLAGNVRTSMEEPESGLGALILAGSFAAGIVLLILSSVAFAKALKRMPWKRGHSHVEPLL